MAQRDDVLSHGALLLEERPTGRRSSRPAPHTDRWWLVDAPAQPARPRTGRGPSHHPSRPQTHSDGLPLGHLFEAVTPAAGLSIAQAQQLVRGEPPVHGPAARPAGHGAGHGSPSHPGAPSARAPLPRRRDLRAGRAAAPAVPPPTVSTPARGLPLATPFDAPPTEPFDAPAAQRFDAPPAERFDDFARLVSAGPRPAPVTPATVDLGDTLPRRRDLRRAEQAPRSRRDLRDARRGELAEAARTARTSTTVARGAVLTGLVAIGVVTISGQHFDISRPDGALDATADLAIVPGDPVGEVSVTGEESYWDAGPDVEAAVLAGIRDMKARKAAAKRAAAKRAAEKAAAEARAAAKAKALRDAQRNPRAIGKIMAAERGWTGTQWTCLDKLWTRESNWRWNADNPSSSAYGIPQALPGSKMASAGSDWATNPVTQIEWGLDYIADRYGTPCNAWAHSENTGWY